MHRPITIKLLTAAAVVALGSASLVMPAQAEPGVSVTIKKGPSYLNTRTTPIAGSSSYAAMQTSAATQSTTPTRGIGFTRWPLPSGFEGPGY